MRAEQLRELAGETGPFMSVYIDVFARHRDRGGADPGTVEAARQTVLDQSAIVAVAAPRSRELLQSQFAQRMELWQMQRRREWLTHRGKCV